MRGGYILKGNGFYLWIHEEAANVNKVPFAGELLDYKLMCFNGKVCCSFVCSDRFSADGLKVTFFDNEWNQLPFERHYPKSNKPIAKPKLFKQMVEFAEKLSENVPFVRTDFYEINGSLYFGELTFSPGSGFEEFRPKSVDQDLGQMINLPETCGGGYWIEQEAFCLWLHPADALQKVSKPQKTDSCSDGLKDYKVFCFDGIPKFLYLSQGLEEHKTARISFVTLDWTKAKYARIDYKEFEVLPSRPVCLNEMIRLAAELSKSSRFCRVDFYEIGETVYFGELTFSPCAGFMPFKNINDDLEIGSFLVL